MARSYKQALTKEITQLFDGLTASQLDELAQYYFDNYGGEGGCEECYEEWTLCNDCYNALQNKARKMTDILR